MSQLTIYLPDSAIAAAKKRAKKLGLSVSAYVTSLVTEESKPSVWPAEFVDSFGGWRKQNIEVPEELPFERRTKLK